MSNRSLGLALLLLALSSARAADPAVQNILSSREVRLEQAKRQYETTVGMANRDALQRLTQLMNARAASGDARGAEEIRGIIAGLDVNQTPAAPDTATQAAIEKRYMELHAALVTGDLDRAVKYVDPKNLDFIQPAAAKAFLGIWSGFLRAGQVGPRDVKVKHVRLGVKGNEAVVESRIQVRGNWDDQKPTYWVLREGQWYLGDEKEIKNFK